MLLENVEVTKAAEIEKKFNKFLKDGVQRFVKPISHICNLSMTLRSFPDSCKIAEAQPLFEKGSKTDPSNYRPMQALTFVP